MYTYAAKFWDLSIVQGPFSVAPCLTLTLRFATFPSLCSVAWHPDGNTLAVGCARGELYVIDMHTNRVVFTHNCKGHIKRLRCAPLPCTAPQL
jgi:WD40 repeat protein